MTQPMGSAYTVENPEEMMADLLQKKLGVKVAPDRLAHMINANWSVFHMLAHAIHANRGEQK